MLNQRLEGKWQKIVNLMASACDMPAGFIVKSSEQGYEVLIASENEKNPYKAGAKIPVDTNTFCKKVVTENAFLEEYNATLKEEWKTNPEVTEDNFNTYVGFPLQSTDGRVFGTICVLDFKQHPLSQKYIDLIAHFKSVVELDLQLISELENLSDLSMRDDLTGLYNRRGFNILSNQQLHMAKRVSQYLYFLIFDIDLLKDINDTHGHLSGDKAIVNVGNALKQAFRESDLVARVGGDEFFAIIYLDDHNAINGIIERINKYLKESKDLPFIVSVSHGATFRDNHKRPIVLSELLKEADRELYLKKEKRRR